MRRETRRVTAVLAVLLSGSFAASPYAKPGPAPTASPGPISNALCGRGGEPFRANLAIALDKFDPKAALPPAWKGVEVKALQRWLEAPICSGASEEEVRKYGSRHMVLEQLNRQMERAKVTEQIGPVLMPFRNWRPSSAQWPSSSECGGCATLRAAAARVAHIASRWPSGRSTKVGDRLGELEKREPWVAELCAALKRSPDARAEIEKRFLYYSWTADCAKLFAVAALFERSEVVAGCRGQ